MHTNQEYKDRKNRPHSDENASKDEKNVESGLTDDTDNTEYKDKDARPVKNATQEGYGLNDGSNQPLSKEMLHDLQDAGQQDLQRQREEEKREKNKEA